MEASAVAVSSGNTGPLGRRRGVGFGILMFIVTLGFYSWYWVFKTQEESSSTRARASEAFSAS